MNPFRLRLRGALAHTGMLGVARRARYFCRLAIDRPFRRSERNAATSFDEFRHRYQAVLSAPLQSAGTRRRVLVVSIGFAEGVKAELGILKALQVAGYEATILSSDDVWISKYYRLIGCADLVHWNEYLDLFSAREAERIVGSFRDIEDMLAFTEDGARVGRVAASTLMRSLRVGAIAFNSDAMRMAAAHFLGTAIAHARAAERIVDRVRPDLALFVDRGYTPQGELFDICLGRGIPCITWNAAHKSNALVLKRYSGANRDEHPASLSDDSWKTLRTMKWSSAEREKLRQELYRNYVSGDWYSECGTQFNKRLGTPEEIRQRLGLDPGKKTAFLFPHILWDGTFFWGRDLFESYEQWFLETVRAAMENNRVNWVIKVHPANVVKNLRDGVAGEPAEVAVIRRTFGELPPHMVVIPAESDLNTYSLFALMDSCLTVRGTIGLEAASFGIPVLTAGTGRYDHRGFTIDSETREQYLARIRSIETLERLAPEQKELAERFAYGVFVARPLQLSTVTLEYQQDRTASVTTQIHIRKPEEWREAPDIRRLAEWVRSGQADYLEAAG